MQNQQAVCNEKLLSRDPPGNQIRNRVPHDVQELSDRQQSEAADQIGCRGLSAHVAHPDTHTDHEGCSSKELCQIIIYNTRHDITAQIQKDMDKDHSDYTERLQKVQLRLAPCINLFI